MIAVRQGNPESKAVKQLFRKDFPQLSISELISSFLVAADSRLLRQQ